MKNYLYSVIVIGVIIGLVLITRSKQFNFSDKSDFISKISINHVDTIKLTDSRCSEFWEKLNLLPIKKEKSSDFISEIIFSDDYIIISDLDIDFCVLIYSHQGDLISKIKLKPIPHEYVDVEYNEESKEILIADNGNKTIEVYSSNGSLLVTRNVDFHYLRFAFSPTLKRYMFYLANLKSDNFINAITITDKDFNVITTMMPISELAIKNPYFSSTRFQISKNMVYYNPDLSNELYSIDFEGNIKLIFDFNQKNTYLSDPAINLPPSIENYNYLSKLIPIDKYYISDDFIVLDHVPNIINYNMIIDRKSLNGIIVHNSILGDNFAGKFNFVYLQPRFVRNNHFYTVLPSKNYNEIMEYINSANVKQDQFMEHINVNYWMLFEFCPSKSLFSDSAKVKLTPDFNVKVFPNPVSDKLYIQLHGDYGTNLEITVKSINGTTVYTKKQGTFSGSEVYSLQASLWNPGTYIVLVQIGSEVFSQTIIVQ